MLKNGFIAVVLSAFILMQMASGALIYPNTMTEDNKIAIDDVVRHAVEDTGWILASSRNEMERVLSPIFAEPYLSEKCESALSFVSVPTGWEYETRVINITITEIYGNEAAVIVDIMETDQITGTAYLSRLQYVLRKTGDGWKITGVR